MPTLSPPRRPAPTGTCSAVVGLQWGDEGKGKIADLLVEGHDAVVRYNGGANAGNSIVVKGERYALHLIPTGILYADKVNVIGNGVVVDPEVLLREIDGLQKRGVPCDNLVVSSRAHVVMPYHKLEDGLREDFLSGRPSLREAAGGVIRQLGTTRRGIGPAYADKVQRGTAVRVGDLLRPDLLREKVELACALKRGMFKGLGLPDEQMPHPAAIADAALAMGERLRGRIADTTYLLHDLLGDGKRILFAGANAVLLDVDHGTYPYVTSSNATLLGSAPGSGVPARTVGRAVGVMKAYSTRVGGGPFPTELHDETGHRIREAGREYGTTTGRPRRVGWLDLVAVRYGCMVNGITEVAVTLLDVLAGHDELKVCVAYRTPEGVTDRFLPDGHALAEAEPIYETLPGFGPLDQAALSRVRAFDDLPEGARAYLEFAAGYLGVPITLVGVGPGREAIVRAEIPGGGRSGGWAAGEREGAAARTV